MSAADQPAEPSPAGPPTGPLALSLILGGNLLPLAGVLLWDWDIFSIFVLYWLENAVIGVFMILRILAASATDIATFIGGLFLAAFFTVHYGMFTMGHGIFVFALFGPDGFVPEGLIPDFAGALDAAQIKGFAFGLAGIVLAEAVQNFRTSFISGQKDQTLSFIAAPYGRIVVLHLTLIFGGMLALSLGQPVWALALLIGLKIAFELGFIRIRDKNLRLRDLVRKPVKH